MSRTLSRTWLVTLLVAVAPPPLLADEKAPQATANSASSHGDILSALQAEAAGDNARRSELLYKTWLASPDLPEANWHTGRVRVADQWLPLGEAASCAASDADVAKYKELRERASSPRALRELARWCRKHDMQDRAQLHWAQLLANPTLDAEHKREAIQALKLESVGGAWFTHDEVTARRKQLQEAQAALDKWLPVLGRLEPLVDGIDFQRRDKACEELQTIKDPAVIVALEAMLPIAGPQFQEEAVKRLATFREYEASLALVRYAVFSSHSIVREKASAALKNREWAEFVPLLVGALQSPLKSQFQVRWDARGRLVYDRSIMQEGTTSNLMLLVHHLSTPQVIARHSAKSDVKVVPRAEAKGVKTTSTVTGTSPLEAFALEKQSLVTRAQLDQTALQLANNQIEAGNDRIYVALEIATGVQQPRDASSWRNWWQDYNQKSWPKPTYCFQQSNQSTYTSQLNFSSQTTGTIGAHSCFVAGTPVRTQTGPRAIESIRPGDRVLAQDVDSGELAFKVVLRTTIRPPAEMVRLTMGEDAIVATISHPFWIDGRGWKMARDVKTGDLVHTLGGAATVDKVEPVPNDKAYNLVVDGFNTYFVGLQGILVHDNEFRRPTLAIVPGLPAGSKSE